MSRDSADFRQATSSQSTKAHLGVLGEPSLGDRPSGAAFWRSSREGKSRRRARCHGFSLLELLLVVGFMAVGVGAGTVVVKQIESTTLNAKLAEDVVQMNQAIQIYQAGGGSLASVTDPTAVLNKLKSVASTVNGNDREIMFVKRSMVDPRLEAVPHSTSPGKFWNWSRSFVRYVPVKARFELTNTAGDDTFLGFRYNDEISNVAPGQEVRTVTWKQSKTDSWVWDYDPSMSSEEISTPEEMNVSTIYPPNIAAAGSINQAAPPTALPAPPQLSLSAYPLNLQLLNPNPSDISRIIYVPPGGASTGEIYTAPFAVHPGSVVSAYVDSLDESVFTDSANGIFDYTPDPEQLELLDTMEASYSYVELGGALAPGSPPAIPITPPTIQLNTGAAIPDVYQHSDSFRVFYTLDGSDPASGAGIGSTPFAGGYPGDILPLSLATFGNDTQAVVRYVGISTNPELFITSPSMTRSTNARKTTLRAPLISPEGGDVPGTVEVTFDLDVASSDMPVNTRIYYRVDGVDPGNQSGEPEYTSTLYTGAFEAIPLPGQTVTVVARVYPPLDAKNWFDTSSSSSVSYTGTGPALAFYGVNRTTNIYSVDPVTGVTSVLDSAAPYNLESIAFDPVNSYLYYLEDGGDDAKLGRYNLNIHVHVDFGRLIGKSGFAYKIDKMSYNLEFWKGSLYMIPKDKDDLVQIGVGTSGITSIKKLIDIPSHGNDDVYATAIAPDGTLYYSNDHDKLRKFNITTLSGSTTLRTNMPDLNAMLYQADTLKLYGNQTATGTRIDTFELANGATTNGLVTSPVITFSGLAEPSGVQPPKAAVPAALYACLGGNTEIYKVNVYDGTSSLHDAGASFNIGALAYDDLEGVIYYLEQASSGAGVTWRLAKLNASGVHTTLGNIRTSWTYNPTALPQNLVAFGGRVYYITPGTDDLVRIDLLPGATGIEDQTRVADISGNATTFATPGDLAVTRDGTVFFVNQGATNRLYRYNLTNTNSYLDIGLTAAPYPALASVDGALYGARGSTNTIERLIVNSGQSEAPVTTNPLRMFVDFGCPVPAESTVASDSLWAIREDTGRARLIEFINYKNQSENVKAVDWGEVFHEDGATYKSFSAGGATTGISGMALTDGGECYIVSNRSLIAGGVTYLRPLLRFNVPPTIRGDRIVADLMGDMKTGLQAILGAVPSATDRITGLSISPADDDLYAVLDRDTGSDTDNLLKIETFVKDGQEQLSTLINMGQLTGAGQKSEQTEDITFSSTGGLYIADTKDDRIYAINPATGAILSTYSTQTNSHYAGLAMHPINLDIVGSTTEDGLNNQMMKITSGNGNDTTYFNYQTRFGLTNLQAIAFFAHPLDQLPDDGSGTPPPTDPGLAGGHIDVDTSHLLYPFGKGTTDGHVHQYDDRYNVVGVNFFNMLSSKLHNITSDIPSTTTKFKIIVSNPDLSPGARISINQTYNASDPTTYTPIETYSDINLSSLPIYTLGVVSGTTQLAQFTINFAPSAITDDQVIGTVTGAVRGNKPGKLGEWRNGALTLQAVLVNSNNSNGFTTDTAISNGGNQGVATSGLLWECTIFNHHHGPPYHLQ